MINQSTTPARDNDGWFVSSFTNGQASCVEVKFAAHRTILVRDSKDPRSVPPIISVTATSWTLLLKDVAKPA